MVAGILGIKYAREWGIS